MAATGGPTDRSTPLRFRRMRSSRLNAPRILVPLAAAVLASLVVVVTPATAASPTGHKHISASLSPTNQITVDWNATRKVDHYEVHTSSTPAMTQDVQGYPVSRRHTDFSFDATTPAYSYAAPSSGNYIYVRVYAFKLNGKIGVSPYRKIMLPAAPPAPGAQQATVATFNVRSAARDRAGHSWKSRARAVADLIDRSNAVAIGLQEAGTPLKTRTTKTGELDITWQFDDIARRVDPKYKLVYSNQYSYKAHGGKEGNRILYDSTAVSMVDSGFFAPSAVDRYIRWTPWALFQNNVTGARFYFIDAHLDNRKDARGSQAFYNLRQEQAGTIIAQAQSFAATGTQVILVGDLNSNIYSVPTNGVHRALISAGFTDAYSTAAKTNPFRVTFNRFAASKKSASRTDYILIFGRPDLGGAWSYKNWTGKEDGVFASDHNMQTATVPY